MLPVAETKEGKISGNAQHRFLPISGEIERILRRQLEYKIPGVDWVFHRKGSRIRDFRRSFVNGCERAKLGYHTPHVLRRSFATAFIDAGNSRSAAMRRTGHVTESMFERYHIGSVRRDQEAAERFDEYVQKHRESM